MSLQIMNLNNKIKINIAEPPGRHHSKSYLESNVITHTKSEFLTI